MATAPKVEFTVYEVWIEVLSRKTWEVIQKKSVWATFQDEWDANRFRRDHCQYDDAMIGTVKAKTVGSRAFKKAQPTSLVAQVETFGDD